MFIDRMGVPHTGELKRNAYLTLAVNDTSSAYSTFCSEYSPEQYETFLVQATEASQSAKTKLYVEKRYGKARADFEEELVGLECERADSRHTIPTLAANARLSFRISIGKPICG